MNALRLEADESAAKVEEYSTKVKQLEQENLSKEQEVVSLQHKNQLLEAEVEKLEKLHGDAKAAADDSAQHGTHNEALTRKLQLLEEEAEDNDKKLRETNEKYVQSIPQDWWDEWVGWGDHSRAGLSDGCADLVTLQAPPDRCQGWSLRAQGASS